MSTEPDLDGLDLEPAALPTDVKNPLTGEIVQADDIDGLISAFEHVKHVESQCYAAKRQISELLASKTHGDAKTRRVEGDKRRAKVEMPDDSWDQTQLKAAWEKFPGLRERCLKIGTISVALREYKKIKETSGAVVLEQFRDAVVAANRGPVGTPRISVEV